MKSYKKKDQQVKPIKLDSNIKKKCEFYDKYNDILNPVAQEIVQSTTIIIFSVAKFLACSSKKIKDISKQGKI